MGGHTGKLVIDQGPHECLSPSRPGVLRNSRHGVAPSQVGTTSIGPSGSRRYATSSRRSSVSNRALARLASSIARPLPWPSISSSQRPSGTAARLPDAARVAAISRHDPATGQTSIRHEAGALRQPALAGAREHQGACAVDEPRVTVLAAGIASWRVRPSGSPSRAASTAAHGPTATIRPSQPATDGASGQVGLPGPQAPHLALFGVSRTPPRGSPIDAPTTRTPASVRQVAAFDDPNGPLIRCCRRPGVQRAVRSLPPGGARVPGRGKARRRR